MHTLLRTLIIVASLGLTSLGLNRLGHAAGLLGATRSTMPSLRVGVLGGPEAEVLARVSEQQPELGLRLMRYGSAESIRCALLRGELEAASFESAVELADPNTNPERALENGALTLTLPLGLYSRQIRSLSELAPGSRLVLSSHGPAQARALLVLYHYGLVGFAQELGPRVRLPDVTRNPRQLELVELPDAALSSALSSASLVALEYEQARRVGLAPARHALGMEDGFSPFAQVLTVRREALAPRAPWLVGLIEAYRAQEVKEFILQRFDDSVRRAW